jgi:hypothetical protein
MTTQGSWCLTKAQGVSYGKDMCYQGRSTRLKYYGRIQKRQKPGIGVDALAGSPHIEKAIRITINVCLVLQGAGSLAQLCLIYV